MSLDLSGRREHVALAAVVGALRGVAGRLGIPFLLIGATARDLVLTAYDKESRRLTRDADFAFMVDSWAAFEQLRQALIDGGQFAPVKSGAVHCVIHLTTTRQIDIVPFGGVEDDQRRVPMPGDMLFDCFGIQEALRSSLEVMLPDGVAVTVPSVPAQILLKIAAYNDRKLTRPGRDAPDLILLMRSFLDCGGYDSLVEEEANTYLLAEEVVADVASAQLAAARISPLLDEAGIARVRAILAPEIDPEGPLLLAGQSDYDIGLALQMIQAFDQVLHDRGSGRD
jgi:predicted nucleotidyltransferase